MKPLAHLTILDLSRVLACPFASMILAELGATVIKVEQPGAGDETRAFEPRLARDSAYYFACNRSKASITANLRHPRGRQVVRELAQKADVLVEDFPAGMLARHGLDFNVLSALNPRLVYVSCTGFGQSGPYARKKGYDTVFQAMGGLMGLTGEKGGGPVKPGLPVADLSSGLWVALGILAMIAGRERSGHGAYLDFSMLDGQVSLLALAAARYFALGEVPPRLGTEHPGRVPSAAFRSPDKAQVPIGPVNDVAEILADPHVRARGLLGSFDYPGVGEFKALALPYRFLGWDDPAIGAPPALGADTDRLLGEMLGYSAEEIDGLRKENAI